MEEDILKKYNNLSNQEDKIKSFIKLLDSINTIDNKKKVLWKEIYQNSIEDREKAKILFDNAFLSMTNGAMDHMNIGGTMAKYIERMSKSNDQILKLVELIAQEEEKLENMPDEEIFNKINEI